MTVDLGPRIQRVAVSDEVIARLKSLISRGVFLAGSKLPSERDLADALAVSRPTLRQALRALQILGVIRSRQGSGSYLADSLSDILKEPLEFALALKGVGKTDLFETRQALEVRLAGLAAQRRTEEDLQRMLDALAKMKKSINIADEWCVYEMRFHECIVHAARNAVMGTIMEMLSRLLVESRNRTIQLLEDYSRSYQSHENVFVAIDSRDAEAASLAMAVHFAIMENRAGEYDAPPSPKVGSQDR